MFEDKLLIWRFKRGCEDAPRRIYEKYKDYLMTLASGLLNDISAAEDIVHSVFVLFAEGIGDFELKGSLKGYLGVCVANRARNVNKAKRQRDVGLEEAADIASSSPGPMQVAVSCEESRRLAERMQLVPYEQREVIVLHLKGGMKFKTIAKLQGVSINTAQSRYRYGLEKLRSLFDGEVSQ